MFWIFIACQNMSACNETDTRIPSVHNPARFIEENNPFAIYYSGIESVFVDVEKGTWSLGLGHAADNPLSGEKTAKWVADSVLANVDPNTAPAMLDALTMYYCKADWTIDDESACIDRATRRNHRNIRARTSIYLFITMMENTRLEFERSTSKMDVHSLGNGKFHNRNKG